MPSHQYLNLSGQYTVHGFDIHDGPFSGSRLVITLDEKCSDFVHGHVAYQCKAFTADGIETYHGSIIGNGNNFAMSFVNILSGQEDGDGVIFGTVTHDRDEIMIGGLSSGGHCAASVSILARDNHSIPILHQYLVNPAVDFTRSETTYIEFGKEDTILSREVIFKTYDCYGLSLEERKKPIYAPLFSEAKGLPPTTIVVGEYDCIRGYSEAYYRKLKTAAVSVKKFLLERQTHCTMYSRAMMSDGPDPAKVVAQEILKDLI